jgi:hypothetical protein
VNQFYIQREGLSVVRVLLGPEEVNGQYFFNAAKKSPQINLNMSNTTPHPVGLAFFKQLKILW